MGDTTEPLEERNGVLIGLCEAEEKLRSLADQQVEASFERFGKTRTQDAGALHSAVECVQRHCQAFPEEYWYQEVLGALLFRANDMERSESELDAATTARRRYTTTPSFVGAAFTVLAASRLHHRECADQARERMARVFGPDSQPWAVDLRQEAEAGYAAAFGSRR